MKKVININGRPVEFTDQKPTRPGAYWWAWNAADKPQLRTIFNPCSDVLIDLKTDLQPRDIGGLWSAPLVPVTEVDRLKEEVERLKMEVKNAYHEGYGDSGCGLPLSEQWAESNAREVAEGLP